jgi:hypothetical protein
MAPGSIADMVFLQLYAVPDGVDPAPYVEALGFTGASREVWHVRFMSHAASPPDEEL